MQHQELLIQKQPRSVKTDLLAGLTVALALVPESIAFSFIAGIPPLVGLYGAFMMCLITALIGGRPGMISGATGALAVVMVSLVKEAENFAGQGAGLSYLFFTLLLVGIIQIIIGILKLGKYVRMIPHPVMMGFVNGLAIVIFLGQLDFFKNEQHQWLQGSELFVMLSLIAITMLIMYFFPKITRKLPAALVALLTVSILQSLLPFNTQTISSYMSSTTGGLITGIGGGLPTFSFPSILWSWDSFMLVLPYAFILASIGLIESLMTLNLIDELTETHGHSNRECIGQGVANFVNGLFGGMGGCAMIGQSIININSGGRGRLAGITAGTVLILFILFLSPIINVMSIAALTGVMFMVVIGTFAWTTFNTLHRIPISDSIVIVLVTGLTILTNLAIAVFAGVILSALNYAWKAAQNIDVQIELNEQHKIYRIKGNLFFASTKNFRSLFTPYEDPEEVIIDFKESKVMDHSAIEEVNKLTEMYRKMNKKITLYHLSSDCYQVLNRADKLVKINISEDPIYTVAED